ncbi:hypothetical protein [Streptomyces sp. NBC_01198]|uniref:hypothetical protein n=1 Tax=Streptomyces sp. NBC_01198 TaxID=2903769 RepID=UPI002E1412EA|nr:hypothetical protein OG702_13910 [Streptomyces sp. NBC_01198]
MTDGPGQQQPPQEPRTNADAEGTGEREVLEGRVIPSRPQSQHDSDPRQQFRRQSPPPPQAPEAGPAWSPQADAATQAVPQGEPWGQGPQQPALETPHPDAATQIVPAQNWSGPPYAAQPQPPAEQQPHAGPQQSVPPQAPAQQQYAAPQQQAGQPAQQYAPQPQPQAPAPAPTPAPAQQQPRPAPQQPAPAQHAAPPPQAQSPARHAAQGPQGQVPFAGGPAARPPRSRSRQTAEAPTPDWDALAEQQEATGARRRRVLMLTGGIVAIAVIAGGVATAVVMSGKSDDKTSAGPSASTSTTAGQQPLPPVPSFSSVAPPPPVNPLDYLNTAAKDKAPLTPDALFPTKQFTTKSGGRTYTKTTTDVTTSCAKNARKAVATALTANGCQKLIRATYTQGDLVVTVGVAVFPDDAHAKMVSGINQYLAPLSGGGVADFCRAVRCQMTANSVGRYAYFSIAGFKNGTTLSAHDTVGKQAANDASDFAFGRIVQRGKDAAAADPSRQ